MTDATATLSDPPQPPPAVIEGDLLCVSCDYNLRGSREFGTCPECGADVSFSVGARWLSRAYPDRVRRIRAGLISLAVSVSLTVAVAVLFLIAMFFSSIGILNWGEGFLWLLSIIILVEHALWLAAAMLLQPPSPWRIILPRRKPQRAWLFLAATLNVLAMCAVLMGLLFSALLDGTGLDSGYGVIAALYATPLVFITRWVTVHRLGLVLLCHARDIVHIPQMVHTRRVRRGLLTGLAFMTLPASILALWGILESLQLLSHLFNVAAFGGIWVFPFLLIGYGITYACTVWALVYCVLFIRRFNRSAAGV